MKRKTKCVKTNDERRRRLNAPLTVPTNGYDDFISPTTMLCDKSKIKKLEHFFTDAKGHENMPFLQDHAHVFQFMESGRLEELDLFFAKYIQVLTNECDPSGVYKEKLQKVLLEIEL